MNKTTYYIAPGAGQSRVYAKENWDRRRAARDDYLLFPDTWKEVGLMNFQGRLVCFSGPALDLEMLRSCEPLMAGVTLTMSLD